MIEDAHKRQAELESGKGLTRGQFLLLIASFFFAPEKLSRYIEHLQHQTRPDLGIITIQNEDFKQPTDLKKQLEQQNPEVPRDWLDRLRNIRGTVTGAPGSGRSGKVSLALDQNSSPAIIGAQHVLYDSPGQPDLASTISIPGIGVTGTRSVSAETFFPIGGPADQTDGMVGISLSPEGTTLSRLAGKGIDIGQLPMIATPEEAGQVRFGVLPMFTLNSSGNIIWRGVYDQNLGHGSGVPNHLTISGSSLSGDSGSAVYFLRSDSTVGVAGVITHRFVDERNRPVDMSLIAMPA